MNNEVNGNYFHIMNITIFCEVTPCILDSRTCRLPRKTCCVYHQVRVIWDVEKLLSDTRSHILQDSNIYVVCEKLNTWFYPFTSPRTVSHIQMNTLRSANHSTDLA